MIKKVEGNMTTLGFVLFIIGACGMDSNSRVIPMVMVTVGMMMLYVGQKRRENNVRG